MGRWMGGKGLHLSLEEEQRGKRGKDLLFHVPGETASLSVYRHGTLAALLASTHGHRYLAIPTKSLLQRCWEVEPRCSRGETFFLAGGEATVVPRAFLGTANIDGVKREAEN